MTIEVYENKSMIDDLAAQVFTDINMSEPVKLLDLPNAIETKEKEILDDAVHNLKSTYKTMFKPTSTCRAPHVHMDTMRENLFEFGVVRQIKADTSEELYNFLVQENQGLAKMKPERWMALRGRSSEKAVLKALVKAKKYKFWLGMPGAMGLVLGRGK
jgi:hypothetical protein|tara:strand:- start:551 stop:1024 length:474 start_codon:yes stop_codon:yes gene_type:complete